MLVKRNIYYLCGRWSGGVRLSMERVDVEEKSYGKTFSRV